MNSGSLTSLIKSRRTVLVCLLLAAATLAVYWQVAGFEFTNYDESTMILKNPHVLAGFTLNGVTWALTTFYFDYWHPLPWISHMLDCEWFGLKAGGHHLMNLGFHIANTLLLFLVLRRMTGALWRSAMVAALFALHPLHVQSVAWVAERKDMLSAFFFFLTLWAYARYAELQGLKSDSRNTQHATRNTPPAPRPPPPAPLFYLLSLAMFACGLMSKPMVVTLPFLLLLLDYWPLRRLAFPALHHSPTPLLRLGLEKLPFFAMTAASCAITALGVKTGGNIISAETVPWSLRLANVPVSYVRYLGKMIWPADLAALYPLPSHWAWWQVGGALVVLAACSLLAVALLRRQPWLAVGWCWFLGTLVPVIGLFQVGYQSMADRYTYIPLVGLFIALVWSGFELLSGGPAKSNAASPDPAAPKPHLMAASNGRRGWPALCLCSLSGLILLACAAGSWAQARYWRNSEALWTHALAVTTSNARAHHNYGLVLEQRGQVPESVVQYREALRMDPNFYEALNNLGCAMYQSGRLAEATNHLMHAVRIYPNKSTAHVNLARALAALDDWRGTREHYEAAMAADPVNPAIPSHWGKALLEHNRAREALERFSQALHLDPNFAEARAGYGFALSELGAALAAEGKLAEAAQHYREALRLQPDLPEVLNNLAWLLATANDTRLRNGAEAIRSAQRACELTQHQQAFMVGTLAAAYAEAGQFEAARTTAQKAIALAEAAGQTELSARNRELLHLYEAGKPCRQ